MRGTDKFITTVVNIAHREQINVTFSDPTLMAQKQALVEKDIAAQRQQAMLAAANAYIDKRNGDHSKGYANVLPHRLFKSNEAGQYVFGGWRSQEEGRIHGTPWGMKVCDKKMHAIQSVKGIPTIDIKFNFHPIIIVSFAS